MIENVRSRAHPVGGFRLIPARALALAWWAYKRKLISLSGLRAWLGLQEMAARRQRSAPDTKCDFQKAELKRLMGEGVSDRTLASAYRQIRQLGLIEITKNSIEFATCSGDLAETSDGFSAMISEIRNNRRFIPVPRRLIRKLAAGASSAVIAAAFAHLYRGLYWHRASKACNPIGCSKVPWISSTFELSERSVRNGRAKLVEWGWLIPRPTPQHVMQRYGRWFEIDLEWGGETKSGAEICTPNEEETAPNLHPLREENSNLSSERRDRNQDLGPADGRPGFSASFEFSSPPPNTVHPYSARKTSTFGATGAEDSAPAPFDPREITAFDLRDDERLLILYGLECAKTAEVGEGWIVDSDGARLRFFALAERALRVADRPGALFRWLVRQPLREAVGYVTNDDEDSARDRIRRYFGEDSPPRFVPDGSQREMDFEEARSVAIRSLIG